MCFAMCYSTHMSEIEDIKARIDLVDLIKGYIPLTHVGSNWRGLCPFHKEKTGSFYVSSEKGIWKCFGCGEGGDHFGFVMRIENLEFRDALEKLAQRAGVELKNAPSPEQRKTVDRNKEIQRMAMLYFKKVLEASPKAAGARAYLAQRGMKPETQIAFDIGYAPDSWDALMTFLISRGYSEREIAESGLVVERKEGKSGYYDRFRDRIMFPIRSAQGDVIAFTSRTLKADAKEAKYINSPQTALYDKGRVLYALDKAKMAMKEAGCAVIVEGQMDTISSHQAGVKNVVAPSGTALTVDHLRQISKYTQVVVFAFDADAAGETALYRSAKEALGLGLSAFAVVLSDAKDPDELAQKDPEAWKRVVANRVPVIEYILAKLLQQYPANSAENKRLIAGKLAPLLAVMQDAIEQYHFIDLAAQRMGVSTDVMREYVAKAATEKTAEPQVSAVATDEGDEKSDRDMQLFAYMILSAKAAVFAFEHIPADSIVSPDMRELYTMWKNAYSMDNGILPEDFARTLVGTYQQLFAEARLYADVWTSRIDSADPAHSAEESIQSIAKNILKQRLAVLRGALAQAELARDQNAIHDIMSQISALNKQLPSFN